MQTTRSAGWMTFWMVSAFLFTFLLSGCGSDQAMSADPNTSNASNASVMTVSIRETQGASGDVYMFDPASITVKKGDTITIQNRSDEMQDIDQGDAQKAGVDVAIPVNQSATMTFNIAGTFTIQSEKGATLTVTVQG
jgi:plastocyanin